MYKVSIAYVKDYSDSKLINKALSQIINDIGGVGQYMSKENSVLIKPNQGNPCKGEVSAVTHPEIVVELCKVLDSSGITKIKIGEGSIVGTKSSEVFDENGFSSHIEEMKLPLVDLKSTGCSAWKVDVPLEVESLDVYNELLENDVIVNVPKLKSGFGPFHMSIALKNIKGCISDKDKKMFHSLDSDDTTKKLQMALIDLNSVIRPSLNICDGIKGMYGILPTEGCEGIDYNILIASNNPAAMDFVCAYLTGLDIGNIEILEKLGELGKGPKQLEDIKIYCDYGLEKLRDEITKKVHTTLDNSESELPIKVTKGNVCSGCLNAVSVALNWFPFCPDDTFDKENYYELLLGKNINIAEVDDTHLSIGSCAARYKCKNHLKGCPPKSDKIINKMLEMMKNNEDVKN